MKRSLAALSLIVAWAVPALSATSTAAADAPSEDAPVFMVLGLAAKPANRVKFEDALAVKLTAQSMRAIASYPLLPTLAPGSRARHRSPSGNDGRLKYVQYSY